MDDRFKRQAEERERLADALYADYASDLPKSVADTLFGLAWEYGHANGEGDVESHYVDFADVAGDAYRAGVRDGAR